MIKEGYSASLLRSSRWRILRYFIAQVKWCLRRRREGVESSLNTSLLIIWSVNQKQILALNKLGLELEGDVKNDLMMAYPSSNFRLTSGKLVVLASEEDEGYQTSMTRP